MLSVFIITAVHNMRPHIAETFRAIGRRALGDWEMSIAEIGSRYHPPDLM